MKLKKETGAVNEKMEELSDDTLDSVSGGANELPLCPMKPSQEDIIRNSGQSSGGNITLN